MMPPSNFRRERGSAGDRRREEEVLKRRRGEEEEFSLRRGRRSAPAGGSEGVAEDPGEGRVPVGDVRGPGWVVRWAGGQVSRCQVVRLAGGQVDRWSGRQVAR